ncbi:transglycosylase [Luteibacter phage vB_LflM-Pluto]|uniref:Transglycosylase n=1 Tax=Luteibacter phage vB_LflM-Pluto TaxID=2948611 RepID=A0A9E7MTM8_9CAUD|nr:transglycosylase [Luteibacter phage vB_LflM-Pluto]
MSDELEKFVLQYIVDTKDADKRLDKLKQSITGTREESDKTRSSLKEFASGASDEISKLVPGVDKVTSAVRAMTAEFGLAAAGVLVLGGAVKSVMDLRERYDTQRKLGMDAGINPIRAENYRRQFQRVSQGRVDEATANDTITKIGEFGMRAYQDPTRVNSQEARILRMMGLSIGNGRRAITPTKDLVTALATKFAGMTPAEVQGTAKVMGISPDAALSMQKLGAQMGNITELTPDDIKKRQAGQDSVTELNSALSNLNEKFRETETEVAQKIVPAFTKLVDVLAKITGYIPGAIKKVEDVTGTGEGSNESALATGAKRALVVPSFLWDQFRKVTGYGTTTGHGHGRGEDPTQAEVEAAKGQSQAADNQKKSAEDQKAAAAASLATSNKLVEGQEAQNQDGRAWSAQMGLAVNMFAGAVASFSNAIDERQAWAAWAGEIGRAAGLGSDPAQDKSRVVAAKANTSLKTAYDDIFEAAARKYDLPVNLIKAHAQVESRFDKNAVSGAGAQGIMQLMPDTQKSLGVKNPFDPRESIMGGAELIRKNIDHYNGDVAKAILAYHGGYDESEWGVKTRAYLGKVSSAYGTMADGGAEPASRPTPVPRDKGGGESRDKIALRSVQQNIATRLGVPLEQLQQGGVNRGDVSFAASQLDTGIQNQIFNLKKELAYEGLPQQVRSRIMTDIQTQQRGLATLQQYAPQVVDSSQPGARQITIGERAIVINVDGSENPQQTAQVIAGHLRDHINDITTGNATGIKY